ncbi:MAG TPA: hypothetical protein VGK29_08375 [Paludibaculum sp.]|jgi:hypothetical protein
MKLARWVVVMGSVCAGLRGADLTAWPEHLRPDPFGAVVVADRSAGGAAVRAIEAETARGAYVSYHLAVSLPEGGAYKLAVKPFAAGSRIEADLYREWFHLTPATGHYWPDALIPVTGAYASRMPEPDNRIAKQTVQAFWLDLWVPATATAGTYETVAMMEAGGRTVSLPVKLTVLAATVPADDVVAMDHNSYGSSWLGSDYPALVAKAGPGFFSSNEFYGLLQAYHRIFYEHRGVFHNLGYGHGGKVAPEYAPKLAGVGRTKHVADWTLYDRHYGPLLDGTAFASTRRGARPIPYVYLPINPEWPATMMSWGEAGYEREFVNVVSEMEKHFREKGWTGTRFELFFNHKKRYKGFPWDGDETRFDRDDAYPREFARMMKAAVPAGTPVQFVFRTDSSWTMERQFKEMAGVFNFWVCGGGMFGWYMDALPALKARGDTVWIYGGTPPVTRPSADIAVEVLRTWLWGVGGFVRWQTTQAGRDPWFASDGGGETLIYPGDRFGIAGPLSSVRLKMERNVVQDLTLLDSLAKVRGVETLRAEAAQRFNATRVEEWRSPRPKLADSSPDTWSNADIDDAMPKNAKFDKGLDAAAWQRVRQYVMQLAKEAR